MPKTDAHGVQRDDSGQPNKEGRQVASQSWIIKNVLNKNVCLKFDNSVFRRHFVVASKKAQPTPMNDKIENKARNRFSLTKEGKKLPNTLIPFRPGDSREARLNRYNRTGHDTTTVIDTTVLEVNAVMTAMSMTLVQKTQTGWTIGDTADVVFTFVSACVKTVKVSAEDSTTGQKQLKFGHAVPSSKVKFTVTRTADADFSFGHCHGPE